jgi:glycosyltransferase involved in cell wall biosynthesis
VASIGARRAHAVVVPTSVVARDLDRKLATDGGNVHVIPWGVGTRFNEEAPAGTLDEPLLERYRLPGGPLALCLGANRVKKNLAAVLHGLKRVHERGAVQLHLVVSGADSPQLRRDLGLVSRLGLARWVSTPGEIPEEDLPGLLRLASVVPILSMSEGFGLPALEALACGTPVVVTADSAQAEVAGSSGIQVDPADPDSVADGLERAVRTREELRYSLPERAAAFTWDRTAQTIENIWERLAR